MFYVKYLVNCLIQDLFMLATLKIRQLTLCVNWQQYRLCKYFCVLNSRRYHIQYLTSVLRHVFKWSVPSISSSNRIAPCGSLDIPIQTNSKKTTRLLNIPPRVTRPLSLLWDQFCGTLFYNHPDYMRLHFYIKMIIIKI